MSLFRFSRRTLLKSSMLSAIASLLGPVPGVTRKAFADPLLPRPVVPEGYRYFTSAEVAFIDAAVSRLIPSDDLGPGAREAGVTVFLDRQLAGAYGQARSWYMRGPWRDGTKQQGYQLKLTPAQLYRTAISAADEYCRKQYGNHGFAQLKSEEQDEVLRRLEEGEVKLGAVPGKQFFDLLHKNTIEGFFADPLYGGNRNFIGWKLIGFPGPRYNYYAEIERYGERYRMPTVGLLGRDGTHKG